MLLVSTVVIAISAVVTSVATICLFIVAKRSADVAAKSADLARETFVLTHASILGVTDVRTNAETFMNTNRGEVSFRISDLAGIRTVLTEVKSTVMDYEHLAVSKPAPQQVTLIDAEIILFKSRRSMPLMVNFPIDFDAFMDKQVIAHIRLDITYEDGISKDPQCDVFALDCVYHASSPTFATKIVGDRGSYGDKAWGIRRGRGETNTDDTSTA